MNGQPYGFLGGSRRKPRYADIIRAQIPTQRRRFFQRQARELEEEALAQSEAQHRESMKFAEEQAKERKKQGDIQTGTALAGTAVAGGTMGQVGAAIGAQHMATENNERVFEGQRTGDVFTTQEGNWRPRFFTEPWMGYASSQMGNEDPTSGEKFDARLANLWEGEGDHRKLAASMPATAHQWFDPFGSIAYDSMKDYMRDQVGGSDQQADAVGAMLGNPQAATDFIEDISYLCNATHEHVGLSKTDMRTLNKLMEYSVKNYEEVTNHYIDHGHKLTAAIGKQIDDLERFYINLKENMIMPVVRMIGNDNLEAAYQHYHRFFCDLCNEFAPHVAPGYAKAEVPK